MSKDRGSNKPDFIIPGFPKCGTTWTFDRLSELPGFSMPYQKEIHYFDRSRIYPSSNYLSKSSFWERAKDGKWLTKAVGHTTMKLLKGQFDMLRFYRKWYFGTYGDDWYRSLFAELDGISGDITPTYGLLNEEDVAHMRKVVPEAKIIFLLRDPIERAWSHLRMEVGRAGRTMDNCTIDEMKQFIDSEGQSGRTDYLNTIDVYRKYFPANKVLLTFFDVLKTDPAFFLKNIVRFLDGEPSEVDQLTTIKKRSMVSIKAKMPPEIYEHLRNKYGSLMAGLADTYGGYCRQWHDDHFGGEESLNQTSKPESYILL